jgi:hypothetical protein
MPDTIRSQTFDHARELLAFIRSASDSEATAVIANALLHEKGRAIHYRRLWLGDGEKLERITAILKEAEE